MAAAPKKTTKERAAEAGAKIPADKLAEAEAEGGLVTVEHGGFEFEFNPAAVTDYRLQRRFAKGGEVAAAAMLDLVEIVLGDQEDDVVASLEDEHGFVTPETVGAFVNAVCEAAGLKKR